MSSMKPHGTGPLTNGADVRQHSLEPMILGGRSDHVVREDACKGDGVRFVLGCSVVLLSGWWR